VSAPQGLGPCTALGDRTFHDVRTASAGIHRTRFPLCGASRAGVVTEPVLERGRFLPTVLDASEPLAPLSRLPLRPWSHAPSCVQPLSRFRSRPFGLRVRVPRVKESPRPLSTTLRKKAPLPSIRDAFDRQVPFVGSGGRLQRARWPSLSLRNPGPATVTPLLATCRPPDDALAPPWAWYRTAPFHRLTDPIRGHSFRTTQAPTFHRRFPRRLGPRSLDPAALFGARLPSLFEARCRLPTSATTCLRGTGTNQTTLVPRWDGGHDLLPLLTRSALSLTEAAARGEPRYVRYRRPHNRFLLLAQVYPTAIPPRPRHHRTTFAAGV